MDGKELKVKKAKKGWAGWIPQTENDRQKFQELVHCPAGSCEWMNDCGEGGLEVSQARLEGAAAEVKATTTANRNKNKFKIPNEIREMAAAAQCRGSRKKEGIEEKGTKKPEDNLTPEGEPSPEARSCRDP